MNQSDPFEQVNKSNPYYKPNHDETVLLQTALKAGQLKQILKSRQSQLVNDISFHLKTAEGILGGIVIILYAYLITIPMGEIYDLINILTLGS